MELTTCLWFNGNAREAAEYYTSIFPDASIDTEWNAPTDTPGNSQGEEVFVEFTIFGQKFVGLNGGPRFPHSEAVSFQIPCRDQEEIDFYWDALTRDGGEESQCGWLKDKFGLSWQVISPELMTYLGGPNPEGAQRATQAMLAMTKIKLAELQRAYEGG
ncbi:MAG: VOC family protein [Actinomycetales bacterium]|nr:VOC family protein [Actinomycetales bacterium]